MHVLCCSTCRDEVQMKLGQGCDKSALAKNSDEVRVSRNKRNTKFEMRNNKGFCVFFHSTSSFAPALTSPNFDNSECGCQDFPFAGGTK